MYTVVGYVLMLNVCLWCQPQSYSDEIYPTESHCHYYAQKYDLKEGTYECAPVIREVSY